MSKINQEEYEVLKGLDDKWKWIARDDEYNSLNVFSVKPIKTRFQWDYLDVGYKHAGLTKKENKMFQFIQWEDEKPHNIAELIEEYEIENGMRYDFGKIKVVDIDTSKLATHNGYIYVKESEETEMKKDKLWAKIKVHEELDSWRNVEGGIDRDAIKYVLSIIDQLDEPEVLSQLSIDNDGVHIRNLGETFEVVPFESLLASKEELPVIPKNVADWITKHRDILDLYPALRRLEDNTITWERIYEWYRMNTNKFVSAYLTGEYKIEEEPLYYALVKGHELSSNEFKYWSCKAYNSGHLFVGSKYPKASCINRMTKDNWNKLGINDSNADFVKLKEEEK